MAGPDELGTVVLAGIVGSTAYGLASEQSDVDRIGFFAAPPLSLLGLDSPALSRVTTEPDVAMHEVGKAARLLLAGNPTVTEGLWLPEDLYQTRTALGEELIDIRAAFLSARRVREAHLGYADQQLRRLINREQRAPSPADADRTAKHARHLKRLVDQGFQLYTTGTMSVRLADPQRCLAFGRAVAEDPESARSFLERARTRFDEAHTALPAEPDRARVQDWLLRVRTACWLTTTG
ncbi:MAG TPA: nucleotidyltransferase domain-containing protein [Pseudonocardiaceae bacterium]|jgi:hypothetical protein|nr:nucleotidyltransferase domain-containing protein [Pseudonocardiaceae bacterium]